MNTSKPKPAGPAGTVKVAFLTGRPRVQTQWVWGASEHLRWRIFALKFAIFLTLPWLTVGGAPALLFDIPQRRFHVFGQILWPQDLYLLGLALALAALMLFFSTTLFSRSWCGFACPQTLLTSLFMLLDHHIEGNRSARLALDGHHARAALWLRRGLKHAAWAVISLGLGFTFVAYFVGARPLAHGLATASLPPGTLGAWLFVSGLTYLFAGHLRDWVCTTVCPYGRFQGAMQDDDSLLVTYDSLRGEPRAKDRATIARGGCVDCRQCVTVCPMGIDIRAGAQYECISCLRCVDACNDTMQRVGAPPDLIRLASLNEVEARQAAARAAAAKPMGATSKLIDSPAALMGATAAALPPWPTRGPRHWLRPRVQLYALALTLLVGALVTLSATRPLLAVEAARDRTRLFALPGHRASNFFTVSLLNKDTYPRTVRLELANLDGQLVGAAGALKLAPGELTEVNASVIAKVLGQPPRPFSFILRDAETHQPVGASRATFVEPGP